ncbi:hypothetical protein D3C75_1296310 [compost metagenome]
MGAILSDGHINLPDHTGEFSAAALVDVFVGHGTNRQAFTRARGARRALQLLGRDAVHVVCYR